MTPNETNRLLGYPDDARLLIINADDFGMCHAINDAIARAFEQGVLRSTTLMVPCPWARHAMRLLGENSELAFGIHLTVLCDGEVYKWSALSPKTEVPSLLAEDGDFYRFEQMSEFRERARLDELETEFRAQIEFVLAAGLKPSHLDWHSLRFGNRTDICDLMFGLAKEYGLALRVIGHRWIESVQSQHLPCIDYDFLDSSSLDPSEKSARFVQLLHELPSGLSEWAKRMGCASRSRQCRVAGN